MTITKVKTSKAGVTVSYITGAGADSCELSSSDPALPEFHEALQALAGDVEHLCELPPLSAAQITVLGATFTYSDDSPRVVISAKRKLANGATLCLNTPCIPFTSQHGPQLDWITKNRLEALCEHAARFVGGQRAQAALDLAGATPPAPFTDAIEGFISDHPEIQVQRNVTVKVGA